MNHVPTRALSPDRDALRDTAPVIAGVAPFAIVIGVTIAESEVVPSWAGLLAAPVLYAGSAHLATLTLLDAGAGAATILATVVLINVKLSFYGAVIEPSFRDQPRAFRWLAPHFIVDQTCALVTARPDLGSPGHFRRYWITAGLTLGIGWTGIMGLALLLGPVLPAGSPLTFSATAVYAALLGPRLRERVARRPAMLAAIAALVASPLPHGLWLLVAVLVGVLPALVRRPG